MVALPLAFYLLLFEPALREDPFYASTPLAYRLVVWSAGYFVHDVVNVVSNYDLEGFGFLVHSFFCCALFCYGVFTMQCQYFGASFLTWEFSTPFVHLRWFLFEMGLKDSRLYFYNGLAMIASFFAARNVLGLYFSYVFWAASELELGSPRPGGFPAWGVHSFRAANVCLNLLNAFWLFKMLTKAAKALRGSDKDDDEATEARMGCGRGDSRPPTPPDCAGAAASCAGRQKEPRPYRRGPACGARAPSALQLDPAPRARRALPPPPSAAASMSARPPDGAVPRGELGHRGGPR
eukprot:CAMPEP_0177610648 /NCGR_PEP_ID=MMETSP0419_2-20121207/19908_1 /TAXON_ID=582737 /ORGANISM="Tetraselmis sp., Strain GSL018" /LENGTH=292 /DNA_ID=CAMNT_0019106001 /DNA_START=265 /DNA_END=1141 /DNA_ORIENTATION=+